MTWAVYGLGVLAFVAASALFSGSETGIYCVNRLRLRLARDRGDVAAMRLHRFLEDEQGALSVILVGTNVANYLTTVFAALLLSRQSGLSDRAVELYTTLLVTPVLFVFAEVTPKNMFQREADRLLYRCGLALLTAKRVFAPVVWCVRVLSATLLSAVGWSEDRPGSAYRRHHVAKLLREALAGPPWAGAGRHLEFVDRVMALPERTVGEVMVPGARVVSLAADTDREAFLRFARQNVYSRVPVVETDPQGAPRIVGVVYVYALLADESWSRVGQRVRPVERLNPKESVASAIVQLQRSSQPIAVVATPHHGLLGVVTLKDLLEEIVGELAAW